MLQKFPKIERVKKTRNLLEQISSAQEPNLASLVDRLLLTVNRIRSRKPQVHPNPELHLATTDPLQRKGWK
jgi:hypothetical protein